MTEAEHKGREKDGGSPQLLEQIFHLTHRDELNRLIMWLSDYK
jgi:hypothetical protein